MISAVADFFRDEINNLVRAADVDWMSNNLYHIIHLDSSKAQRNLRNAYLNIIMKRVGTSRTQKQKSQWIKQHEADIDTAVLSGYKSNYTDANFRKYYVSPNPLSMAITSVANGWEITFAPGSFSDRAIKSSPQGAGNVPFVNRMFASVFADALVDVGKAMPSTVGSAAFRNVSHKEARKNNPRNVTHGLTTSSGRPSGDALQTTAEVGLAKSMMGVDGGGNYIDDADFDTRIRRDSIVAAAANNVGHKAATYIIETVNSAVERKLKISDLKNSSLNEINREHQIHLEYADARHNKLMQSRDKDGLLKWVNNYENKLLNNRMMNILTKRFSKSALHLKGSDSILESAVKITPLVAQKALIQSNLKGKNKTLKVNPKLKTTGQSGVKKTNNSKTKRVGKKTNSTRKTIKSSSTHPLKIKGGSGGASRSNTGNTAHSAVALKELINQALPEVMLLKMRPPALRNRTGRFRQSAEVTNVNIGPRGGTQIDYTYMRDPYETFEPGGDMGSRNRDPRKIIGESVREIAMRLTGNKFITTRRR